MAITTNDKNLGHATAYAYAKSKGYTGTEEEFAELMASYATVAESAEESRQAAEVAQGKAEDAQAAAEAAQGVAEQAKDTAVGAKDTAASAASTATTKAGEASASATSASSSASAAAGSATSAASSASAASESEATATTKAGEASNSATAAIAAQEAAEDAQEVTEQAAASVSASAAQIATNTADISNLKNAIVQLNYFDSHGQTEGYTRVQNGVFSPTSGYYDTNLIPCLRGTDFYVIIEKKLAGQALPETSIPINFFNSDKIWLSGNADYPKTATEITAEESIYGFGGWKYKFTTPENEAIAYWSTYFSADRWNRFGLFCYYQSENGNIRFLGDTPVSAIYFDKQIPLTVINGLSGEINSIKADTNMQIEVQSLYADWADFDLGYLNTSGQIVQPYENAYTSDYISIVPGSTVEYYLRVIGNFMYGLAWYNDAKVCLGGVKHTGDDGTWQNLNGTTTLPDTARYIRFSGHKYNGTAEKAQYVTYTVYEKVVDYLEQSQDGQQWQGKKWVAFGTSITDTNNSLGEGGTPTGKYIPYLQKMSGMQVTNKGIAGGAIGIVSGVLSGQIMNAIKSSDNLAIIQAADIITIEGFVNDFVGNLPIGTIFDTDNSTLMGALYEAVTYLYSQNEDATIVLITESTGQYIDSSHWFPVTRNNALGKYQYEYNDAIITMAHYLGCHVIDAGQKSQINQWHTEYLADWIHHSELGGKQYAETIWNELKNIHCNSDVSVE